MTHQIRNGIINLLAALSLIAVSACSVPSGRAPSKQVPSGRASDERVPSGRTPNGQVPKPRLLDKVQAHGLTAWSIINTPVSLEIASESAPAAGTPTAGSPVTESSSMGDSVLLAVTYSKGQFAAVGKEGTVITSTDGKEWTKRNSGTRQTLRGIIQDESGKFVAVGKEGTIITSTDGKKWTKRISNTELDILGITYGKGKFVAVGHKGIILTSTNGETWEQRAEIFTGLPSGKLGTLFDITYADGKFVAVGDKARKSAMKDKGAASMIITSTDGYTWYLQKSNASEVILFGVTHGDGKFIAVGSKSSILISADGEVWEVYTWGTESWLFGIIYAESQFIAVGSRFPFLSSTDGKTWNTPTLEKEYSFLDVTYGDGKFAAVGVKGITTFERQP